ncbi:MAG: hypothetical protein HYX75_04045 [Acidobacteria bacterium]|nr:hypothetical protein [Acidobacteriota bacterium]
MADTKNDGVSGVDRETRGGLRNFVAAYRHIRRATGADDVKQRLFDHVTVGMVGVAILSLVASVAFPFHPVLKMVVLGVTVSIVFFYMIHRMGIFLSVTPRQALIFWQIMLGALWLGITAGLLVMMIGIFLSD